MEPCLLTAQSFEIDRLWPQVIRHIQRWVDHDGTLTTEEVRSHLRDAKAQLWYMQVDGTICGIWVTRLERSQRVAWGLVWGCAGDFSAHKDDAIALYEIIENWFRECGCEFVEWGGREGWQRIFPGYERHAVVLRKRL